MWRITVKRPVLATLLVVMLVSRAFANLFSPDKQLAVLETEYFSFIFAPESRPAVQYLTGFADDAYREIAALLGTTPRHRFPVVMTPDSEELNGYFTWMPYLKIVLYQAPTDMNSTLGSFNDDLRKLFYHELTHAVSLTIRSGIEEVAATIFGAPFSASTYLAPLSFVEGVTVSLESHNGAGRAADPLLGAWLRQDILENQWKNFTQAAGAWDSPPGRGLYYIYGGYFSRYLQEKYGMEAYSQLWHRFGAASVFKPLDASILGEGRFSEVYGLNLTDAWNDFKTTMTPRAPIYMATEPLRHPSGITAMATSGSHVYYADEDAETVYSYDTRTGIEKAIFRAGFSISRLDVSPDGMKLLISTVRYNAGFPKLVLKTWDSKTYRLEDVPTTRMRDATWIPGSSSIAGISIDGYQTDLVTTNEAGTTVLLAGTENISYASPVVSHDGKTLYALEKNAGKVSIIRLNIDDFPGLYPKVERLVLPESLTWIRYLSLGADEILRFSWDDELFYRLAELDGNTLTYQRIPLSGGVHWPVYADARIYYLGYFSAGSVPCAFPKDTTQLHFTTVTVAWEPADECLSAESVYDAPSTLETTPYTALRWLVPHFWLPTAQGDEAGLKTLGLLFFVADPAERLSASTGVDWNLRAHAVDFEMVVDWKSRAIPVALSVSDSFESYSNGTTVRTSIATLDVSDTLFSFWGNSLAWNVRSSIVGTSESSAGASAYAPWSEGATTFAAQASLSDLTATSTDKEAQTGYNVSILARLDASLRKLPEEPPAGLETRFVGKIGTVALACSGYVAAALTPSMAYGPAGRYSSVFQSPVSAIYPSWQEFWQSSAGVWFTEGEASFRLLGVELQRGLGMFYANRLSIRTGSRGFLCARDTWTDGGTASGWSLFGRVSLTWTPALGSLAGIHPESYLEFWCRPDLATNNVLPYGLSYMLVASY